jgi:hypothetical protein
MNDFNSRFPEYASVEEHIRKAQLERSVAIATWISDLVVGVGKGIKRLVAATGNGVAAERDRRAIEADAFLKRSVPRY